MDQLQAGSKWAKIIQPSGEGCQDVEEEEDDDNEEVEYNNVIDDEIKKELTSSTLKDDSTLASESVAISLQWLDKLCGITPTTKRGHNIYMACMLLIPLIPIFALITQNVILLNDIIIRRTDLIDSEGSVERSDEAALLVSTLQKERSEALFSLFVDNNIATQISIGLDLKARFLQTDKALENVKNWRSPEGAEMFRSKLRFQIRLDDFRKKVIENNETNADKSELVVEDAMGFYNYATRVLLDDLTNIIRSSNGSSTWRFLITYKNVLRAIESIGIEMSFGIRYQATGKLARKNIGKFIEQHKLSQEYLLQSETFLSNMRDKMREVQKGNFFKDYDET